VGGGGKGEEWEEVNFRTPSGVVRSVVPPLGSPFASSSFIFFSASESPSP